MQGKRAPRHTDLLGNAKKPAIGRGVELVMEGRSSSFWTFCSNATSEKVMTVGRVVFRIGAATR